MSNSPSSIGSGTPPQSQSSTSHIQKERRRRIRHHKSRKGCYVCKQRRVKCDEVQPICGACAFRGDSCSYPPEPSTSIGPGKPRRLHPATDLLQPLEFRLNGVPAETTPPDQAIDMADMRLLTRFIMRTSRAMSLEARRSQAWEHVIPDMVLKKEYLMHLVLALAGEHFLYEAHLPGVINDSQSALLPGGTHQTQLEYHRMIQHHQKGLEGFRQALSDISPATAEYVFCGAILIVANAFASLSVREHDLTNLGLSNGDDHQGPHIDWLHLVRGLTSVVGDHWYILKLGRLRSFLFYTYGTDDWKQAVPGMYPPRLHHAPRVYSVFAQGASQAISMLRSFATTLPTNNKTTTTTTTTPNQRSTHHPDDDHSSEIDEQYPYDHLNTLDKLEIIYMRILYALQFSRSERHCPLSLDIQIDIEESAVTSWPQMVSNVFIAGLQPSEPPFTTAKAFSYIILGHFYTISVLFKDLWYLNSGFRHEIKRICSLVDKLENHELSALMAWPMAVVAES